jgi:ATP-dependent helicase/nuclease subunit B
MRIETIPFGVPFLSVLANTLIAENLDSPHNLARHIIILPTQKACMALEQEFIKLKKLTFLPKLIPISQIENSIFGKLMVDYSSLKTISSIEKIAIMMNLVLKFKAVNISQAYDYASSLLDLIKDFSINDVSLKKIKDIEYLDDLTYWQDGFNLLKIIGQNWEDILKSYDLADPETSKILFIKKLTNFLKQNSFSEPLIICGSTGSLPMMYHLIECVLGLKNGRVILPCFDVDCNQNVDPTHPQYTMQNLLKKLGLPFSSVKPIVQPTIKTYFLQNLMTNQSFVKNEDFKKADFKISRMTFKNIMEEAKVISLIIRYYYEDQKNNISVITPNLALGNLIKTYLKRWDIVANPSSGIPAKQTLLGEFLFLTSKNLVPNIVNILATLKNPLVENVYPPELVEQYEIWLRRDDFKNWYLEPEFQEQDIKNFWLKMHKDFIATDLLSHKQYPFADLLAKHLQIVKNLITNFDESYEDSFVKNFLENLKNNAYKQPDLTPFEYGILFPRLMDNLGYLNTEKTNPRIAIVGNIESRLNNSNITILASLNEGDFPKKNKFNPWLSSSMEEFLGLPPLEKTTGLSAHDFCSNFSAEEVFLTRALEENSNKTNPSRFLLRLESLAKLNEINIQPKLPWQEWSKNLDNSDQNLGLQPLKAPLANPPLEARGKNLSVTSIEKLMRDPYGFYVMNILKLKPLDDVELSYGYREKGIFFHRFCEEFFTKPDHEFDFLLNCVNNALPYKKALNFWYPQLKNLYTYLKNFYQSNSSINFLSEEQGEMILDQFRIRAKADRVDVYNGKIINIVDYKTTTPPSDLDIKLGFSPQVVIEAMIAKNQGFKKDISKDMRVEIWHIKGKKDEVVLVKNWQDISNIDIAINGLKDLLDHYQNNLNPYLALPIPQKEPSHNPFLHIERHQEWK